MHLPFEEKEALLLFFALGVVAFMLVYRRRLAKLTAWRVLWASFFAVLGAWALTALGSFLWPNLLGLLSHLCYAASSVLAAVWCWFAFVSRPREGRDVARDH